jgi:predicted nucleic acid-binding protein
MRESLARQALQLSAELEVQLIQPDQELVIQAFDWTLRLKRAAAYDSFYLALARCLDCDLWTADRRLANAVGEPWVRYMGKREGTQS